MILRNACFSFFLALWCLACAALPIASGASSQANADLRGQRTHYLHTEWGLLAEADASGQLTTTYGWNPQRDNSVAPLFARTPDAANPGQWRTVYYHNDHLGAPQRITDKSGAVIWAADYDAYGKAITRTTADSAKAITSNLRYPGQYWDAETGLHYNDRRYYDPETGRYLSSDPIGYEGGINLYAYAGAAPGRFIDPTGEFSLPNLSPPCMLINYGRCNLVCNAESALGDAFTNCGEVNWAQNAKDCLKSCLWSMLPIPDPCGMFGKLFSMAVGALGGNSFPGETLVHTKDRQGKPALKPIADIQIGDEVLAWDELAAHDGQEIQAKTGTSAQRISAKRYEKVSDLITSERERKLVHITLEGGKRITATDGHPFRTSEGWRDAVLLKKGAKLLLMGSGEGDGSDKATVTATIEDVRIEVKTTRVYNLEVENLHTFFVGVQGVVVHNGRSGTSGENGPARTGRQQHENYRPEGFERPTLPSGKRPDGVNYDKKIVVELKPNNWRQYKRGCKQVQGYVDELNRIDGPGWRGFVTFY